MVSSVDYKKCIVEKFLYLFSSKSRILHVYLGTLYIVKPNIIALTMFFCKVDYNMLIINIFM